MGCANSKSATITTTTTVANTNGSSYGVQQKKILKEIRLLMLGAGDSGKSTVAKQLKIIFMNGFTQFELQAFTLAVLGNLLTNIQCLLRAMIHLGFEVSKQNKETAEQILQLSGLSELTPTLKNDTVKLLSEKVFEKTLKKSTSIYLPDSCPYFLTHAERILSSTFIPTQEDVLRSRIKTMGINEISFDFKGNTFRVVDVGGQRSERRKWIHCFQDVNAIIFCTSLSEYNLSLEEDETVNRMHESLLLFKDICESEWFKKVTFILFLNKVDVFKQKIGKIPLTVCFPENNGSSSYDEGIKFIEDKFTSIGRKVGKVVYSHMTYAIDTDCIRFVFDAIRFTVIQDAINSI